jgi:hypothetical protein
MMETAANPSKGRPKVRSLEEKREIARAWRAANVEHLREYNRKWRQENQDHRKAYDKAYKDSLDPEKVRAQARARRAKNSEAICAKERAWRAANKDIYNARYKARRAENRIKYLVKELRARAKKRGIEFSLVESDIIIPEFCPVLGLRLTFGEGSFTPNSPSVDRINNNLGYVSGNIIVVSNRANMIKGDATVYELKTVAAFYEMLKPKKVMSVA